jgi:hypothetical protein
VRAIKSNSWPVWIASLAAFAGLAAWHRSARLALGDTAFVTGYVLFALILFLALYNGRKKLPMIPAGRASAWLTLHVVTGVLAVAVFWLHTQTLWPLGLADQALAALFYVVCASGALGYALQLWIPGRLTQSGRETIYERIPADLAELRAEIGKTLLAAAGESGHDTLGRYYLETLDWYFARPRFAASHVLGGRRAEHWLKRRLDTIERYLSAPEQPHLGTIARLGALKIQIDHQYALQTLLKRWTLVHVPLAAAMLVFAVWHLIVVHVFAR